jgi:glutamate 5-kinase
MGKNLTRQIIIIKVGTNVLAQSNHLLNHDIMRALVAQIAQIRAQGAQVVLVSSGAVGAGRGLVHMPKNMDTVTQRQIFAAVGQIELLNVYRNFFNEHHVPCAQVLVTKEDFRDRRHYLNMRNCFTGLLAQGIIPIVNENDVVSVTELMFTDNDELSGLIASMLRARRLIILTNVDGVYDGNPKLATSKVIPLIAPSASMTKEQWSSIISPEKSQFGRGGMITKAGIAEKLAEEGIAVHIANGLQTDILADITTGKRVGTTFVPHDETSGVKRWISHSEGHEKATITINAGARTALLSGDTAASVLPVGVVHIEGMFDKGDIIKIIDEQGKSIGYGMAQYGSVKALESMGKQRQKPLIHYDYLVVKR